MTWLFKFLTSSIGRKVLMSLTGLFLCSFLIIHLLGNFQLLIQDGGETFNEYAYKMTHFLPIKIVSYGLYASILLHAFLGIMIAIKNRKARGNEGYKVKTNTNSSWASKNMALLGSLIFVFIGIHMAQFWGVMHFGDLPKMDYGHGHEVKDLYTVVASAYTVPWIVAFYVISMIVMGFHLMHGFQSAFQSLGLNHKKYTPIIKGLGFLFYALIPIGFAIIPIIMYVNSMS